MIHVSFREAKATDHNFVIRSWLDSYFQGDKRSLSPEVQWMAKHVYYVGFNRLINDILDRPTVTTHVAVNPEDDDQIFGFIVSETVQDIPICHYVYVKHTFRKFGIGLSLFRLPFPHNEPVVCTFANFNFPGFRHKYNLTYDPLMRVPNYAIVTV